MVFNPTNWFQVLVLQSAAPRSVPSHPGVQPCLLGPHLDILPWAWLAQQKDMDTERQRQAEGLAEGFSYTRTEKKEKSSPGVIPGLWKSELKGKLVVC